MLFKSITHLNHYVIYITLILFIVSQCIIHILYILVRIFLFMSRYFFCYLSFFSAHLSHCMFVFSHTSQYYFTHISQYILCCILYVCIGCIFYLHFILFTHISYGFILTSHSFCQNLFCNTCIAYVGVSLTFGFDFFYFQKRSFTHICFLSFENIRI